MTCFIWPGKLTGQQCEYGGYEVERGTFERAAVARPQPQYERDDGEQLQPAGGDHQRHPAALQVWERDEHKCYILLYN